MSWSQSLRSIVSLMMAARHLHLDLSNAVVIPGKKIILHGKGIERVIPIDEEGRFTIDWSMTAFDPRAATPAVMIAPPSYKCWRSSSLSMRMRSVSVDMVFLHFDEVEVIGLDEPWGTAGSGGGPDPIGFGTSTVRLAWD